MGGKITSPKYNNTKCHSSKQRGAHRGALGGAVVLENNYALKHEVRDRPAYVMGYVNTFAVEKYESNDTEEGLPSENYEDDEVFISNTRHQMGGLDSCICGTTDNCSSTYLLIDSPTPTISSGHSLLPDGIPAEKSLILKNEVYNSNHIDAWKTYMYNNNVHISGKNKHNALMHDEENTLNEDISKMSVSNEHYQHRTL